MANYFIIGGDGKQYGPITTGDLLKWIAEGRLNAQSLVKEETDTEFRALAAFPEFAAALGTQAPATGIPPLSSSGVIGGREAALRLVKSPAVALKVTAILGLVLAAFGLAINILTLAGVHIIPQQSTDPQMQKIFNSIGGGLGILQDIISGVVGVVVLIGAGKMQTLKNFPFALTASIVAMVPCISPCCILGLPFGIWALVVLNKPEVKSQFT